MSSEKARLDYLDSLRGLAASFVVFYHVWNRYYPNLSTQGNLYIGGGPRTLGFFLTFPTIQYGYFGVHLFFVLSGYCIHMPQARRFWKNQDSSFSVRDFSSRRFWRLYPAYFASLVFTSGLVAILPIAAKLQKHLPIDWVEIFHLRDLAINALFLQQFEPDSFYFNGVYWTLLYEFQFYLMYPFILWATRRINPFLILSVLVCVEIGLSLHPTGIMSFGPNRLYEWYLGIVAIELVMSGRAEGRQKQYGALGLVFMTIAIISTFTAILYPFHDLLISTGFFGLLLWIVLEMAVPGRELPKALKVLNSPWLVFVGLFSYSLYLIHLPIIDFCYLFVGLLDAKGVLPIRFGMILAMVSVPISFVAARVFYYCFELPFMPKKTSSTARQTQESVRATS